MTWLDELPPEEKNAVEELKKRTIDDVTPKMLEDPSLFYRFSKARNFNLKNAEIMLRKNIAWRKEYGVDTILTDYKAPEVFKKYTTSNFIGFDKDGNPVRYIAVAGTDTKGILNSAKRIDIIKHQIQLLEEDTDILQKQSQKLGKLLTKVVLICDYDKFTFAKATNKEALELSMIMTNLFQDNYPERIKTIYCINASIYFTMIFSLVKAIVAEEVIEKIRLFGTEGWKEALLEVIDPDVLPAFLGGQRTDPDGNPLCNSFIIHGELVPEHYYLPKSKKTLHQEPGVKKLNVTQFSNAKIKFDVDEPGSWLEWEFETKSKDIGFGLYFKDKSEKDSKPVELVPKHRFDTCIEPETGIFKCEKAGTYVMVFDNSYSWLHPKEIYYRAKIVPPNKQDSQ